MDFLNILLNAKDKLTGLNELGKYNVQQPLYRFNPDSKTLCFIYNYVKGRTLKDFIEMRRSIYDTSGKRSTFDEIALLAQIIPQVLKGIIYLHRAGVVHMDLSIMNIMVYQNQNTHEITATIVDYDSALPLGLIESKEIGAIAYANVMADVKLENFGSCSDDNDYITYIIGNLTAKSYVKKEFIESDGWKAYTRAVIQKQLDMRKETMSKRQMDLAIKRLLPLLKAAKHLIANNSNCATANQELSSITSSYANH
ncbi:hypothetical protein BDF19DRAFT_498595 [Syncephalis fuscata]|nr:hypothetical protein BDF19DRAFT_498595 [Syncephalis fuscata]